MHKKNGSLAVSHYGKWCTGRGLAHNLAIDLLELMVIADRNFKLHQG